MGMKRQDPPFDGPGSGDGPGASRHRRGDVGFDRWLKAKLHHTFDPVLEEKVPDDLMKLLQRFDAAPANPGPSEAGTSPEASTDDPNPDEARTNGRAPKGRGTSET